MKLLLLFRAGPFGSLAGQEGLDAALSATAMDLEVSVAFIDDSVFMIKAGQLPRGDVKSYTKTFGALEDFGVERILVDEDSLNARGLSSDDLSLNAEIVNSQVLRSEIATFDRVMVF